MPFYMSSKEPEIRLTEIFFSDDQIILCHRQNKAVAFGLAVKAAGLLLESTLEQTLPHPTTKL